MVAAVRAEYWLPSLKSWVYSLVCKDMSLWLPDNEVIVGYHLSSTYPTVFLITHPLNSLPSPVDRSVFGSHL